MSKKLGTPIQITLYGPDDEVIKECSKLVVPWKILKRAMRLIQLQNKNETDLTEEDIDSIADLVVEAFGNQFTRQDLDDGADITDMMSVLQMIVNKAQGLIPNPTPPAS